jgi:hypothetical protein
MLISNLKNVMRAIKCLVIIHIPCQEKAIHIQGEFTPKQIAGNRYVAESACPIWTSSIETDFLRSFIEGKGGYSGVAQRSKSKIGVSHDDGISPKTPNIGIDNFI